MYKEHNMVEEIAHGLCDNCVKPSRPGVQQTLTLMPLLPWTAISAKAGGITINLPALTTTIFLVPLSPTSLSLFSAVIFNYRT